MRYQSTKDVQREYLKYLVSLEGVSFDLRKPHNQKQEVFKVTIGG